ncbi:MAG: outer membrane protein assembly factor BamB family protein [Planctomycetota bacterium]|jgi:outer membrane protein assembly factor BamB
MMQNLYALLVIVVCCTTCRVAVCRGAEPEDSEPGRTLIDDCGIPGGICVVAGSAGADVPLSLARHGRFVVHALFQDGIELQTAREAIRTRGVYGRVSADHSPPGKLPYVENLINLLVVERYRKSAAGGLSLDEINRVLAPLGVAYLGSPAAGLRKQALAAGFTRVELITAAVGGYGIRTYPPPRGTWLKMTKPWPADIDEWPHHLHAADGNPVANDRVVGPPEHYQWVAGPVWAQSHETDSNLRCLVTARGRVYYIVNDAPTSLAGPESPPDKWSLAARDAFNGVLLWKRPIQEWGWRQWKPSWFTPRPGVIPINLDKRLVAAGDHLYVTLGYRAPVSRLDGRTGEVLKTYEGTARTSEILHLDGRLVLTVLRDGRALVKLIDAASGRHLWTSEKDYGGTTTDYYRFSAMRGRVPAAKVDPTLDIATDGRVVALLDGDSVVGLDYDTGRQRWRSAFPLVEADYKAGRIDAHRKVWTGTMIVSDGVVLHASPNQLAAFSATTGGLRWKRPKKFLQHLWYEWKDVFVVDGLVWTWSAQLARGKLTGGGNSTWPVSINGYDLKTGELKRQIPLGNIFKTHHHHRCYRNKATVHYVLASRRGTEFVDLSGGKHSVNNWVRGTCHMGMMPANGLQYAPPHPCQCYIDEKLNAFNALAPARKEKSEERRASGEERLEKGPAYSDVTNLKSEIINRGDWPTFRSDAARAGSTATRLPADVKPLWQAELGGRVAPPIAVGQRVFVPLVDQHQIVALSAADGGVLWRFTAGARIDSPPSYVRTAVLFGSADGWVYRVEAATGRLVWRLRAAPEDRRMAAFGQLESAWPVHGSVLVDGPSNDSPRAVAYFAAGRSSHLDGGLYLLAVDAMTGEILHERNLTGPSYTVDNIRQNYRLPMGVLPDVLRMEDSALFMRAAKFDAQLRRQQGRPNMKLLGGLLDDAYFKRMPWSIGRSGHARLIVHDPRHAYCLRMFDSLQGLDPKVYFTPGKKGYLLFAHDFSTGKNAWEQRIPIRGQAMVVTDDQLCVAGPPDVVEMDDPLAAFEGRKGGVLRIVDKADGRTVSEHKLASPPVFNGAAAANGRLLLSLEDGSVACYGSATSVQ